MWKSSKTEVGMELIVLRKCYSEWGEHCYYIYKHMRHGNNIIYGLF